MDRAEALERSTKAPGQRDGVLGQSALMILRALLCHFLDTKSGRCDPSYKQIQKQTGFCVQTIAVALKRLERAGILDITRRIARKGAQLWNELIGRFVWRERVEQQTNAYRVNFPTPDRTSSAISERRCSSPNRMLLAILLRRENPPPDSYIE